MATTDPRSSRSPKKAVARDKLKEYLFVYEGKDKQGKKIAGEFRSTGDTAARSALRRRGIVATKLKKKTLKRGKSIKEKDIALFTRQLSTMMRAGVPMLQSFDIVAKGHANPAMSKLLYDIRADIETGSTLEQSFKKYPQHFDPLFCNLVAAGEQAGILDKLLDRLAAYKEKMLAIKGKVKSALIYPAAIVGVAVLVTTVIMIFVVPAFKNIFSSFGAELPLPTQIVISMSDFMVKHGWIILLILGAATYFFMQAWRRSPKLGQWMDRLLLKTPIFGELVQKATISRWCRTLSTMFAAGVPMVEALDSVGGASGNHVYVMATRGIQQEISTGTSLAVAMDNSGVFPNMAVQMAGIGEESGSLEELLGKVADFYDREVDEMVDAMSSLLEPIILVILGVLVGGLVVAMYLPIFKLGSVVS